METVVVNVTPELAESFLEHRASFQREIKPTKVKAYVDAIRRGEWKLTHQGIAFDTNGKLVDGQHRLHAIKQAGIPVQMSVTRGVAADTFNVLDIGAKRTTADLLKITAREAQTVSFLGRLVFGSSRASPQQHAAIYDELQKEIALMIAVSSSSSNVFNKGPAQAAGVIALHRNPENTNYILDIQSRLVKMDLEGIAPVGQAILRQCFNGAALGTTSDRRWNMFARMGIVYDPAKRDLNTIKVSESQITETLADSREYLRSLVGGL